MQNIKKSRQAARGFQGCREGQQLYFRFPVLASFVMLGKWIIVSCYECLWANLRMVIKGPDPEIKRLDKKKYILSSNNSKATNWEKKC